ncbi:hypothetical protein DPMN_082254 [Dreissena polymorpha]|uniref:Uncharacterized protein n=1 Tax=Dreissena polymorpha TaxID=45954 RepID=A0A9D3Y6K5_DREPO|nr:hypothetical protein DPMN_082254 [Dreissena polymorpha]
MSVSPVSPVSVSEITLGSRKCNMSVIEIWLVDRPDEHARGGRVNDAGTSASCPDVEDAVASLRPRIVSLLRPVLGGSEFDSTHCANSK